MGLILFLTAETLKKVASSGLQNIASILKSLHLNFLPPVLLSPDLVGEDC